MTDSPPDSFLRPVKVILLLLIGGLVYLVALMATLPAGWLWQQVEPRVELPPGVSVDRVTGSLWQGTATLAVVDHKVEADWQVHSPSFANRALPLSFSIASASSSINGGLQVGWSGETAVNADGRIRVADFEREIRQAGGAMLAGDIVIDRLDLKFTQAALLNAEGLARWAGGEVSWPMAGSTERADFPPMEARVNGDDQGLALTITQAGQAAPVAETDILANGMMDLKVYKRLVDLAGQPWSGAAQPGDVVFRVRQPLLPDGT